MPSANSRTVGFPDSNQLDSRSLSNSPEIALIISTYQRPEHLERCLLSVATQTAKGAHSQVAGELQPQLCDLDSMAFPLWIS